MSKTMGLGEFFTVLLVAGGIGFLLWTMPIGRRIATRFGLRGFRKEGATKEDREFLLQACGGDWDRVRALLEDARAGQGEMSDAQTYRRAIRKLMRDKHGGRVA